MKRLGYFAAAIQFWIMAWASAEAQDLSTLLWLLIAVILFVKATPA